MPNLRDIRKRIESIKNTGKITKAMKMVSAAKLKRAQTSMMQARPYSDKMNQLTSSISNGVEREAHPLLNKRDTRKSHFLIITADKGLCGAFNANIIKKSINLINERHAEGIEVSVSAIGKKAVDFFKKQPELMKNSWTGFSRDIPYDVVREIAAVVIDSYINEEADEILLIYNEFKNVMSQVVVRKTLLPLEPEIEAESDDTSLPSDFLFEPSDLGVLNQLLPKNVEVQILRAMLESRASEEAARMVAMENATNNTKDLINKLTLEYNKARQAAITAELMDIVGGAAAIS